MPDGPSPFNEHQQRRLITTCQMIDKMLFNAESALGDTGSKRVFPEHIADISPAQRLVIEDCIGRVRAELVRILDAQNHRPRPSIPVSRELNTAASFIEVNAEELAPEYMKGYGPLSDAAAKELQGISDSLRGLAAKLLDSLHQRASQSEPRP